MDTPLFAFSLHDTLVDTQDLTALLALRLGVAEAGAFTRRFREKQSEFTYRRGLMGAYADFHRIQREALEAVDRERGTRLGEESKQALLAHCRRLRAFADAPGALTRLRGLGVRCVAFANASRYDIELLLDNAGLADWFEDIVSAEEIRRFQPDATLYAHLRARTHSRPEATWLISAEPAEIIGARYAGLHAAWLQRDPQRAFESWGDPPDLMAPDLDALATQCAGWFAREG
ncbi:HAD family hydrolase [Salinicola sp. DM10]|uniref:HAD family hydrolase n=1 Tax=Salinicola sp. DM10 TaxID=2815721 RepID=UPI001A8DEA00|nr:HAD family hydrolase [Salinicola sp. DM10]MCE3028305.1 HAD hydrolase-like protein [Salinicola sp. DM10]